ncbi:hypothetical protein DDB_G0285437 [Dictyostelium discoideum AX4]|uniref:Uncharacterized protein n=1 Tax=Dictyostelium discoideum TaxID=44689 RepID=Q54N91_DICDI|nr:hypothetical protein DDB_G0285437 [Dictyostelium discoideum AX4]EAL64556.1 hypothetical protein DDB_G0285437 [Dictyostelium discoideum AX4]|eukprot:XP_638052.1 hypothetical protein DDB_G0285437 [Dictyostelium discoideum AX4]
MCEKEINNNNNNNELTEKSKEEIEKDEIEYLEYLKYRKEIIDSHCHIHEDVEHLQESCDLPFKKILLMGTTVEDWDKINQLADKINDDNKIIRCFGIHPWFVYNYLPPTELIGKIKEGDGSNDSIIISIDETWRIKMKELLLKYPNSIVGEIGIDKVTKVRLNGFNKNDQESQMRVFRDQIEIANELDRLVSLHCVQLQGQLLTFFQSLDIDKFPPAIALHTFGGKPATVDQFCKMASGKGDKFYFGLSFINLTFSKVDKLIQAIPDDRLLLESDQNSPTQVDQSLFKLIQKISISKNWTIQKTIEQTTLNTLNFLSKQIKK